MNILRLTIMIMVVVGIISCSVIRHKTLKAKKAGTITREAALKQYNIALVVLIISIAMMFLGSMIK